jgi:hypothetical protein
MVTYDENTEFIEICRAWRRPFCTFFSCNMFSDSAVSDQDTTFFQWHVIMASYVIFLKRNISLSVLMKQYTIYRALLACTVTNVTEFDAGPVHLFSLIWCHPIPRLRSLSSGDSQSWLSSFQCSPAFSTPNCWIETPLQYCPLELLTCGLGPTCQWPNCRGAVLQRNRTAGSSPNCCLIQELSLPECLATFYDCNSARTRFENRTNYRENYCRGTARSTAF